MDIYKNSFEYAKENGEIEQYRENLSLCEKCGTKIHHSIAEHFNNNHLDVKKITAELTEEFGFERTMLMLALRVDSLKSDGRVDITNKEWASRFLSAYPNADKLRLIADRTLGTTHPVLLDGVAEEVRFTFLEMNKSTEREVEGYRIIQTVKTPTAEFLFGQNKNMPSSYVTWLNGSHDGGISAVWGHYFTSNNLQKNLLLAYQDLFTRALTDVNQHTRFEELAPKIGSIIRNVNGEDMRFDLTDEECNGIWNMVDQQNVEDHFKDLLSANGYDVRLPAIDKIVSEMAAKYRDDFGFGNDDEYEEYIDEREDDLREVLTSEMFGDVSVDKDVSDYTGRIMIIRPEFFTPSNCTPENQLFLAQSGKGCDSTEYGGAINGILLYDREETTITSDNFLGAMREEHIPNWAREAREDIAEESSEDQPEI